MFAELANREDFIGIGVMAIVTSGVEKMNSKSNKRTALERQENSKFSG